MTNIEEKLKRVDLKKIEDKLSLALQELFKSENLFNDTVISFKINNVEYGNNKTTMNIEIHDKLLPKERIF
jgi:hypothetical protein